MNDPWAGSARAEWLTSAEATARLGVKRSTLYAYVSRGLIQSERTPGLRTSRFLRADVERLAAHARGGGRAGRLDIVVDSQLTLLDPSGQLHFRGWDVADAVATASYEQVAEWLWTGRRVAAAAWTPAGAALEAGRRAQAGLPAHCSLADRLRVIAAAVCAADPLRHDRRPTAVAVTGRRLIAALVDCLPRTSAEGPEREDGALALRLWTRLSPLPPTPARVAALDDALVLLADHGLAASTLAARVAASTWADPCLVVLAGLAALGGPLHGGASESLRALLAEVRAGTPAEVALGERLRRAEPVPGFGHPVYHGPDPRAALLLRAIGQSDLDPALWAGTREILAVMEGREGPRPNVDFALGVLTEAGEMLPGAGESIFAIARSAGWIAHGMEEYRYRLRFRSRAAYTGPPPTGG